MRYRAVLFDLFDTLVEFDRNRLPEIEVNGRRMRSTGGLLHAALRPFAPGIELQVFVEALGWSWQEAERVRNETHREVAAPERLRLLFQRLGIESDALDPQALPTLLSTHMRELSKAAVLPPHHAPLLEELRRGHRLAVVSNFDYTPTALAILDREGITRCFDTIVVSDEVGWRKPKPVIFEIALERLGVSPAEALFVGDRADIDVAGAQAVGMRAAWINPGAAALPPNLNPPDFEIRDLRELRGPLGI